MIATMPRKSRLKLPPLNLGPERVGDRLKRLRKARGLSQVELAKKIGIIQVLVSNYERDRLRLHGEMVVRFARALGASTDEILGLKPADEPAPRNRRLLRRLLAVETLSKTDQRAVLNHIESLVKARAAGHRRGNGTQQRA
jgi:transcriptional regulator with XRE-family HTH domain